MILFIIYVILSTSGLILFKLGSKDMALGLSKNILEMHVPLLVVLGLACYLCSFILWMVILAKSEISFIVPLGVAVTNIAILLGSFFILHETITTPTIIGATLIILGVIVMNIK
ncbi:MAG: hypothetical protein LBM95_08675 [Lactobacillales bacterium]|jgi:drug/metabolite transporter (DMT)-like permease|nr:hypothetical protein [Lactobacillales bacterium]